jgi:hypothetical protein
MFDEVKTQTPDYFEVSESKAFILELTVSNDPHARNRKAAKYALLCSILKRLKIEVKYVIFVVNPKNVYMTRLDLIRDGLSDSDLDKFSVICKNADDLLRSVHNTVEGEKYYAIFHELSTKEDSLKHSIEDVMETHRSYPNKCFFNESDLRRTLEEEEDHKLTDSDFEFITEMSSISKEVESELTTRENFDEKKFYDDMKKLSTSR